MLLLVASVLSAYEDTPLITHHVRHPSALNLLFVVFLSANCTSAGLARDLPNLDLGSLVGWYEYQPCFGSDYIAIFPSSHLLHVRRAYSDYGYITDCGRIQVQCERLYFDRSPECSAKAPFSLTTSEYVPMIWGQTRVIAERSAMMSLVNLANSRLGLSEHPGPRVYANVSDPPLRSLTAAMILPDHWQRLILPAPQTVRIHRVLGNRVEISGSTLSVLKPGMYLWETVRGKQSRPPLFIEDISGVSAICRSTVGESARTESMTACSFTTGEYLSTARSFR